MKKIPGNPLYEGKHTSAADKLLLWDEILGNISDIVIKYDFSGKLIYINEALHAYVNIDRREFIGKSYAYLAQRIGLVQKWQEGFDQSAICRKAHTTYADYDSPVKGACHFETVITPIFNAEGDLMGFDAVVRDISSLRQARKRNTRNDQHWELMMELSQEFMTVSPEKSGELLNKTLERVGQLFEADRSYIFEYDFENGYTNNTHECCFHGVHPEIDNLQQLPVSWFPEMIEKHQSERAFIVNDVKALSPKSHTRMVLEPQGVKSMLSVSIMKHGECIGFIGVDYVNVSHLIKKEEEEMLVLFAGLVGNLYQKNTFLKEKAENEARFKLIVDRAFAGIYIMRNERFEFVNQLFCRLTGYTAEELKAPDFKLPTLLLDTDKHARQSIKERRSGDTSPKSYQVQIKTKDGVHKSLMLNTTGIHDNKGVYTLGIAFDVSHVSDNKQAINDINKALTERNASLKEFAHIAAHNLRSPLANISGLLGLMDRSKLGSDLNTTIVDGIDQCITSMNETLNDMLLIIGSDDTEKRFEKPIVMSETFTKVAGMLEQQIAEAGATINCNFKCDTFIYNVGHIENFMLNMLTNAFRYRDAERPLVVNISCRRGENEVIYLTFEDNGCGIDLEKYGGKIFKMYQKFHDHPESRGIGLYLVKNQLDKYGGQINVESKPGAGTRFEFKLLELK